MPETVINQPVSYSLAPYSGAWTKQEAAHLLRRTLFGPSLSQINNAVSLGISGAVAQLLTLPPLDNPLAYDPNETVAAPGTDWTTSVYPSDSSLVNQVQNARLKSLGAWMFKRLNTGSFSIQEKICFFWHNHFAVSAGSVPDPRAMYVYLTKLNTYCLGNFKQLVKEITIDPAMLLFLNGATNTVFSPNENYSRELLELFSIGKGPQVGEGDYTNYTEQDVAAGAKILTGYLVQGLLSSTETSTYAQFNSIFHNNQSKQLSPRMGNAVISANGANEYADYIDTIFNQVAIAENICTKIYRYFVNYDITQVVKDTIISGMAQTLVNSGFSIQNVLEELLKSEHFYDSSIRGAIIKNPIDIVVGMLNSTDTRPNFDLSTNSDMYLNMYWMCENLGQPYAVPPSVAGWSPYYQIPSFSKLWINSTHIKTRFDFASYLTMTAGISVNGSTLKVKPLSILSDMTAPSVATSVIDDLCTLYFTKGTSASQKLVLKAILTNGQPDATWTSSYNAYAADPSNISLSTPIKQRLEYVLWKMFQMPEFQVI